MMRVKKRSRNNEKRRTEQTLRSFVSSLSFALFSFFFFSLRVSLPRQEAQNASLRE
jgi:hypothetical protein